AGAILRALERDRSLPRVDERADRDLAGLLQRDERDALLARPAARGADREPRAPDENGAGDRGAVDSAPQLRVREVGERRRSRRAARASIAPVGLLVGSAGGRA